MKVTLQYYAFKKAGSREEEGYGETVRMEHGVRGTFLFLKSAKPEDISV